MIHKKGYKQVQQDATIQYYTPVLLILFIVVLMVKNSYIDEWLLASQGLTPWMRAVRWKRSIGSFKSRTRRGDSLNAKHNKRLASHHQTAEKVSFFTQKIYIT
jgi:hypothetical protein